MTEAHPNYEANPRHYLRRAAEVLGYPHPEAEAECALVQPEQWRTIHRLARYISLHEPLPDPDAMLLELARRVVADIYKKNGNSRAMEQFLSGELDHDCCVRSSLATLKLGLERGVIVMGEG